MAEDNLKRTPGDEEDSASYCCEAAETVQAESLPNEDAFSMKRDLGKKDKSASYCCEAAHTLPAEELPPEDAF